MSSSGQNPTPSSAELAASSVLLNLRAFAFWIFVTIHTLVIGLGGAPLLLLGRKRARIIPKLWTGMTLWALRFFCGVSHKIEGVEHLPKGGAIVAANHQSMWETIAIYNILENPVMIFKKELLLIPIYGWWGAVTGSIPVDRKGGAKALRAMRKIAAERIRDGHQIIVFPEGTRVAPGERSEFRPGVAGIYKDGKAPCVPIAHDSGRLWHFPGYAKSPGVISVKVCPALPAGLDRKTFVKQLQTAIDRARPDLTDNTQEGRNNG